MNKIKLNIYIKLFSFLKNKKPRDLDVLCKNINERIFNDVNCLDCAKCCKTISPIILERDIENISKYLRLSRDKFKEKYISKDEENDYVFNMIPCPFLLGDNKCMIYDFRPKACKEYPHIDRKKIYQIDKITIENAKICKVVELSLDEINRHYK